LFVALVDKYDDGNYFEEIDIRIRNADYSESTFFTNKLNDVYNNRDNLDLDPLIQEIGSMPRTFKEINLLREKLSSTSTDEIRVYWTKRNSSGQITESSMILLSYDGNDSFEYATYENSDTGSIRTEVINSLGQKARDDLFSTINTKSAVFNNEEYNGVSSVALNRSPQFSGLLSKYYSNENQTSIVTVSASDPDANTSLTYSLSGTDSSLFDISSSGVLTFKSAPDYETPGDADADNSYQINVIVSDGSLSVTQAITVQVQNVADLISGVAVDGYVAGATVFQDLIMMVILIQVNLHLLLIL